MTKKTEDGPFSRPARLALIARYFGDRRVPPHEAWKDVYRLLLWSDATTGLAHCYESDKAQPGRPWYARTLAFHRWLATELGVSARELPDELDWMFRQVIRRVAKEEAAKRNRFSARAVEQRQGYEDMPAPGDDPELRAIIERLLPDDDALRPTDTVVREALREARTHITNENKRKNLLGRGFEDVLGAVIGRLADAEELRVGVQTRIQDIPGFRAPRTGDKDEKVDLWLLTPAGRRVLVSAKWSVRADREKQFAGDFETYISCEERREPFDYVWITNEFDPARLRANATNLVSNRYMFDAVVHVAPDALRVVHQLDRERLPATTARLKELLDTGRIVSLGEWLDRVSAT